jgi:hypothetical protein
MNFTLATKERVQTGLLLEKMRNYASPSAWLTASHRAAAIVIFGA